MSEPSALLRLPARNTVLQNALVAGLILDVGTQDGRFFGDRAVNLDIKAPEGKAPNFVIADGLHLPFRDGCFDFANYAEVLEHIPDPGAMIEEGKRVASILSFSVPNEWDWPAHLTPFQNKGHVNLFDEKRIRKLFADHGLTPLEFMKLNFREWSHFIGFYRHSMAYRPVGMIA
jgi:hypothetical protein